MKTMRTIIVILAALTITFAIKLWLIPPTIDTEITTMDNKTGNVLEVISTRTSIREYTDQKVTRQQLDTLVRAAMAAPSAMNRQPWAFVAVDDKAVVDKLVARMLEHRPTLSGAQAAVIVCGDTEKSLLEPEQAYWVQDCAAASMNLLLAAHAMELGAVWTGVFPRAERIEDVKTTLNLPDNIIPLNVILIGYPKGDTTPKDKYQAEIVHYNSW